MGIVEKLKEVNSDWWPAHALYLYGDLAYYIVYRIMGLYNNYFSRPQTSAQNKFNKAISQL